MNFIFLLLILLFVFKREDIAKKWNQEQDKNKNKDKNNVKKQTDTKDNFTFYTPDTTIFYNSNYSEIESIKIRLLIAGIEPNPGPQNLQKCKNCDIKYDNLKMNHCENCCSFYRIDFIHCCKCKKNHGQNSKTIHCAVCCEDYYSVNYHCCCGYSATKKFMEENCNLKHCCNCGIVSDLSTIKHCDTCCVEQLIDSNLHHCCRCAEKYNSATTIHCDDCHTSYNKKQKHCCICKENWDSVNLVHCCNQLVQKKMDRQIILLQNF